MEKRRYLTDSIDRDALRGQKMAFISGPRQVGKSTMAKQLLTTPHNYFLYDSESFRRAWHKSPEQSISERGPGPVIFDEIHKDRAWKRKLKGIYDLNKNDRPIIVTGSARLDHYRKGSDSLLGRYLPYRLHPFSVAESEDTPTPETLFRSRRVSYPWSDLLRLGGFPEPLVRGNEQQALRWSRLRLERLVLEDSHDFRNISDHNAFRVLIDLLPERVGSRLSINALREDVGKAYATVRSWVEVLDLLYFIFTIRPYSKRLSRAVKSEPKLYLYDILRIPAANAAQRQENLAALHLLKACQYWTDLAFGDFDLRFIRDKEGNELDFVVLREGSPWMAIECKSAQKRPAANLIRFSDRLKIERRFQLVSEEKFDRHFSECNVRVLSYQKFFSMLV